ncbi:MAG: preprotein translocase subunit SecG [Planctomycetales bacterium]|nr:preprotein translocase subunit SecG [Planctomycetales bacterium]
MLQFPFLALGQYVFGILLSFAAIFLILLVLIQRGRGGGLSGAFGGMGGQSAFGTKAGDVFTKITVGVSIVWIVLCISATKFLQTGDDDKFTSNAPMTNITAPQLNAAGDSSTADSAATSTTAETEANDASTSTDSAE